ncbi:AcrR family transcriptional regulator [Paenibacillus sp. V4I7]|nr:AcrR family transcriptional regulator [Paenibacillus sp. V4I7]
MTVVINDFGHFNGVNRLSREVKKKKTKEDIIRNAIELFKEKGYANVTVEEIAFKSDIAKGTFFNYFQKKEHLLLHLSNSYMQLMSQIVDRHKEGSIKERLLHIQGDLLRIYLQHADLLRLTLVETIKSAFESPESTTNISLFQETLGTIIENAKISGDLRSRRDSNVSAAVLVGLFINLLITCSSKLNEEEMFQVLRQQLDVVWEGIADE